MAEGKAMIKAGDIKVGDLLAEADGFLFEVAEIMKETPKTITVRLVSDYSSIPQHWRANGGVKKTFRKTTMVYGIQAES